MISPKDARSVDWLARTLASQDRRLTGLETKPGLAFSSIENGSIDEYTVDGTLASVIGKQHDGTHTATSVTGPKPPTPWFPAASAVPGVVEVRWNGKFAGGALSPMDLKHVAAYVVPAGGPIDLTAQAGVMTGELGDAVQVQVEAGVYDVYLVAWTLSGKYSDAAGPAAVVVPVPADMEAVQAELDAANTAIDAVKTDLADTKVALDTRLDTAESDLSASKARLDTAEGQLTDAFGQLGTVDSRISIAQDATLSSAAATAQEKADEAQAVAAEAVARLAANAGNMAPYGDNEGFSGTRFPLNSAEAHSGERAWAVTAAGTQQFGDYLPDIPVAPGAWYRFGFWYKLTAPIPPTSSIFGMPMVWVTEGGAAWNTASQYGGAYQYGHYADMTTTGKWLYHSWLQQAPAVDSSGAPIAKLRPRYFLWSVNVPEGSTVRIDDFTMQDVTAAKSAIDAAATAQAAAEDAHQAAGDAQTTAESALTMAGSKSKVYYSTSAPSGTGTSTGDLWRQVDASRNVISEWYWSSSNAWQASQITTSAISNLDVGKLTVGTGVIATLVAQKIAGATASFQTVDVKNLFATTGTLAEAVITRLFTDIFATNKLSANQVLIGSGENLVPNGSGELGSTAGWPAPLIYDAVDKPAGDGIAGAFRTVAGQGTVTNSSPLFSVNPGEEYLFEVWLKADKPDSRIYMEYRDQTNAQNVAFSAALDADGAALPNGNAAVYFAANAPVPTTWTKWTAVGIPGPTVEKIRVSGLYFNHPNGTERNAVVSVAGFSVRPRVGTSLVATGAIIAPHITASEEMSAKLGEFLRVNTRMLEATAIDGMVITGAIIQSPGEGAGYQLTSGGYTSWDAEGNLTVRLPSDGSSPQFRGDIEAQSLTASGRVSLRAVGNEITSGAELIMESGVTAPLSPPSVNTVYASVPLPYTGELNGINTAGLARANNLWWRTSLNGTTLQLHGISDAGTLVTTIATGLLGSNGVTAIGNELFVLGRWGGAAEPRHVAVYNATTGAYVRRWVYTSYGTGKYQPGIGTDGTSVLIAQCWADTGKITWRTHDKTTGAVTATTNSDTVLRRNLTGIYRGAADFGTTRVVVAREDGATNVYTSAGVNVDAGGWWSAGTDVVYGLVWDGAAFRQLTGQGSLVTYSGFQDTIGDTDDWWICTTWTGAGGSQTTMGPAQRFLFWRRSELQVSAGILPAGATGMVVYLARKATVPNRADFHALGTFAGSTATIDVPADWATGSNPLSVNTFNTSTPGLIRSRSANFEVKGDGTGHWGPLAFNADGTMTSSAVPAWVPITSFRSGFTVGDFGFVPSYRSWPDGKVELRGVIKGTMDLAQVIADLPTTMRPAQPVNVACATSSGGGVTAVMRVEFGSVANPDGITIYPQGGTRTWASLDGLSYYRV
ncbi:hypothetical protein JTF08_13765 [Micrococcaceae bacterium RIT802]|nr:hypothetical protein [Micrococcaceae bacterium RIT 802]